MLTVTYPLTAEQPFYFAATVKGWTNLKRYKVGEEKASFLEQPMASGDWYGALIRVCTRSDRTRETFQLFGKVTWGEFIKRLHELHPTGTWRDVDKKDDDEPEHDYEFYNVKISFFYGTRM